MEHIYFLYQIRPATEDEDLTDYYIGITNNPNRRFSEHVRHAMRENRNKLIHQYASAHGVNSIKMFIIDHGTKEEMCKRENELRPRPFIGWNTQTGGDVLRRNTIITEAHREILRRNGRGRKGIKHKPRTEEHRQKVSKAMRKSIYTTPLGVFDNLVDAGAAHGRSAEWIRNKCDNPAYLDFTRTKK